MTVLSGLALYAYNHLPFFPQSTPLGDLLNSIAPSDLFVVVTTTVERNAIAASDRQDGMLCYVSSTMQMFQLQGGITNTDWVAIISTEMVVAAATPLALTKQSNTILYDAHLLGGNLAIVLPSAATCFGKDFTIIKSDSSANRLEIVPDGTDKINGNDVFEIVTQFSMVTLRSDGIATWFVLFQNLIP